MRKAILLAALLPLSAFAQSDGQNVGEAIVSVKQVALKLNEVSAPLGVGDAVKFGGVVSTGAESANVNLFDDGTKLSVGPNSTVAIDKYVYSEGGSGEAALSLTRGTLRLVSGRISGDSVRIDTPNAHIGIRGTRFVLEYQPSSGTLVVVEDGAVAFSSKSGGTVEVARGQASRVTRGDPSAPEAPAAPDVAVVAALNTSVALNAAPALGLSEVAEDVASSASAASASAASTPSADTADYGGDGRY